MSMHCAHRQAQSYGLLRAAGVDPRIPERATVNLVVDSMASNSGRSAGPDNELPLRPSDLATYRQRSRVGRGREGPAKQPRAMSVAPEQTGAGGALGKETVSALGDSAQSEDCDPYLQISIPSLRQSRHTRYIQRNRNPDWNETLAFTGVTGRMEMMDIRCMVRTCRSQHEGQSHGD